MRTTIRLGLGGLCALLALAGAARAGNPQVGWKGSSYAISKLPADVPAPAREAIDVWTAWVGEHGYRFDLDRSGRVLLISPSSNSALSKQLASIERVVKLTDERLPARVVTPSKPSAPLGGDSIPEDPESPPPGAGSDGKSLEEALRPKTSIWGAGTQTLDRDTVVLLVLKNEEHYASVLTELVKIAPYLSGWAAGAVNLQGFTLEQPLAGAFLLAAAGQEEWDPENELVHRAAELLLLRRFGRQPFWLQQGWAWHVEMDLCADVYCFPYRSEFVWASEHTGWDKALRDYANANTDTRFTAQDIGSLRRGAWDDRAAKLAWGTALYLDRQKQGALPLVLDELRQAWDSGSRRELGGGQWERDISFEVTPDAAAAILERHAGADFFAGLTQFFRAGAVAGQSRSSSKSPRFRRD